jgi:signal transduction histidine kinase
MKHYFLVLCVFIILISNISYLCAQDTAFTNTVYKISVSKDDTGKVKLLIKICDLTKDTNLTIAGEYGTKALELSKKLNYSFGTASGLQILANNFAEKYDYKNAILYYKQAADIYMQIHKNIKYADCMNNLGIIYTDKSDNISGINYYLKALTVYENYSEKHPENLLYIKKVSTIYNNLGIVMGEIGDYAASLDYHKKSLKISRQLNKIENSIESLINLASVYSSCDSIDKAEKLYNEALEMSVKTKNKRIIPYCYTGLGMIYHQKKNYKEAVRYLNMSTSILKTDSDMYLLTTNYSGYARIYNELHQFDSAKYYADIALKYGNKIELFPEIKDMSEILSHIYEKERDYNKAYSYSRMQIAASDSIEKSNSRKTVTRLEMQYKFDKEKQKHTEEIKKQMLIRKVLIAGLIIVFLLLFTIFVALRIKLRSNRLLQEQKQDITKKNALLSQHQEEIISQAEHLSQVNTMLQKQKEKLEQLSKTKDKIFSIIAHDLRSPFNSILGFSELILLNIRTDEIGKTEQFIETINSTAKNTLSLLENLLTWAKSQTGQISFKPEIFNLKPVIEEILNVLDSASKLKLISIKYLQSDETEIFADKNMLKTVLRNLISNAIKFSNIGDKIDIRAIFNNNFVEISVSDHGVGMNEETQNKLFTSDTEVIIGTSGEKGSGLGLVLCKEFIEKHGGKIWVESEPGNGSIFTFILPKQI